MNAGSPLRRSNSYKKLGRQHLVDDDRAEEERILDTTLRTANNRRRRPSTTAATRPILASASHDADDIPHFWEEPVTPTTPRKPSLRKSGAPTATTPSNKHKKVLRSSPSPLRKPRRTSMGKNTKNNGPLEQQQQPHPSTPVPSSPRKTPQPKRMASTTRRLSASAAVSPSPRTPRRLSATAITTPIKKSTTSGSQRAVVTTATSPSPRKSPKKKVMSTPEQPTRPQHVIGTPPVSHNNKKRLVRPPQSQQQQQHHEPSSPTERTFSTNTHATAPSTDSEQSPSFGQDSFVVSPVRSAAVSPRKKAPARPGSPSGKRQQQRTPKSALSRPSPQQRPRSPLRRSSSNKKKQPPQKSALSFPDLENSFVVAEESPRRTRRASISPNDKEEEPEAHLSSSLDDLLAIPYLSHSASNVRSSDGQNDDDDHHHHNTNTDDDDDNRTWWDEIAVDEQSLRREVRPNHVTNEYIPPIIEIDTARAPSTSMTFDVLRMCGTPFHPDGDTTANKQNRDAKEPLTWEAIRERNHHHTWKHQVQERPPTPPRARPFCAVSTPMVQENQDLSYGLVLI